MPSAAHPGLGLDNEAFRLIRARPDEARGLIDDELVRHLVADVYASLDSPECAALRSRAVWRALTPVLERRRASSALPIEPVVGHRSAAWIHAGGPAPHRIDLVSPPGRARWRDPLLVTHEHRLGRGDVDDVAGVLVTSPARTAADLARTRPAVEVLPILALMWRTCGLRPTAVLTQLDRMARGRGVRLAREVVGAWASALADGHR